MRYLLALLVAAVSCSGEATGPALAGTWHLRRWADSELPTRIYEAEYEHRDVISGTLSMQAGEYVETTRVRITFLEGGPVVPTVVEFDETEAGRYEVSDGTITFTPDLTPQLPYSGTLDGGRLILPLREYGR